MGSFHMVHSLVISLAVVMGTDPEQHKWLPPPPSPQKLLEAKLKRVHQEGLQMRQAGLSVLPLLAAPPPPSRPGGPPNGVPSIGGFVPGSSSAAASAAAAVGGRACSSSLGGKDGGLGSRAGEGERGSEEWTAASQLADANMAALLREEMLQGWVKLPLSFWIVSGRSVWDT